ncbi:unnamed protein product [Parnassius mnemosyne]|uniref:Viral A-type inclusion protein n=1 Tax=Parnassius mnemosyne TaxID=213953 RepID=A0AAV1LVU6_9NEOP
MDTATNTEDLGTLIKTKQENILLEIIKSLCNASKNHLSAKLVEKVNRIIAHAELTHYASLHKLSTADESTSTLLGVMHQTAVELTFDEQAELNQAIIQKIQNKLPDFIAELEHLKQNINKEKVPKNQIKELQESVDNKLGTIQSQESEKVELMIEWINHRLHDVSKFSDTSSELLTLKTKILNLKSKILHLQILQNIFTETNQSIKAYSEVHRDLKESIIETEQRIKNFKDIVESDYN